MAQQSVLRRQPLAFDRGECASLVVVAGIAGDADRTDDGAAVFLEAAGKGVLGVDPRRVVADQAEDARDAVLRVAYLPAASNE